MRRFVILLAGVVALVLAAAASAADPPARLDRYGDPLPAGAIARLGTERWRHAPGVVAVAYSSDGRLLAAAYQFSKFRPNEVVVRESATGRVVRRFRFVPYEGLTYTAGSRLLVTPGDDGAIRLLDLTTGETVRELHGHPWGATVTVSADSRRLASLSVAGEVIVSNVVTGRELRRWQAHPPATTALVAVLSSDGNCLATQGADSALRIWQTENGRQIGPPVDLKEVPEVFSPDGQSLLTDQYSRQSGQGEVFRLRDVATGRELWRYARTDLSFDRVGFAPDGRTCVIDGGRPEGLHVRDVASGQRLRTLAKPGEAWGPFAFSPDGKVLTANANYSLVQLDLATGRRLTPTDDEPRVPPWALAVSPDGRTIAAGDDGTLWFWDVLSGRLRERESIGGIVKRLAYSPDGSLLALELSGETDHITEVRDMRQRTLWRRAWPHNGLGNFSFLSFSPDGRFLAGRDSESDVVLWRVGTFTKHLRIADGRTLATALAWSPDGNLVALLGVEKTCAIRVQEITTGREVRSYRDTGRDPCNALAYSPDGKAIVFDEPSGGLSFWDQDSGKVRKVPGRIHGVGELVFSPDGKILVVADHLGVVHLWEAATRQEFHCFEGAENALRLAFLPDGFTLATTGPEETTILLWDVLGTRTARSGAGLDRAELNRLWSDLDRPDATVAYRVLRTLATDPDGAVGWFRDHLHPQPLAGRERIKGLIEDLGSDRYSAREHATRELRALDTEALPALRKALKSAPTLETRRRIEQLIDQAEASPHPDRLRGTRAVQLFEALATPAARELLKEWAAGPPGGWLTEDAAVALKRLDRRPAAEGARP